MPAGRPPKFSTVEELEQTFLEWKATFQFGGERYGEVPDVESFCDYVDAWRDLLCEYEKKPEYSDAIKRIKNWIYARKKQLAFAGKMPPAVFIFDAKNNAGYVDKQEVESKDTITHKFEDMTDEQLDAAIKAREARLS